MTEFVYVTGKVSWFRHIHPEIFGKDSAWKHTLHPNQESMDIIWKLKDQGLRNEIKKDEDGYYINFRRPTKRIVKGKEIDLEPPQVVDKDGNSLNKTNVGNGSDVITKLEVYEHKTPTGKMAKAARWLSTRIDNLIPYEGGRAAPDPAARAVKGLDKQPTQQEHYF